MYDGEHGPNGPMGEHKPSEECRAFVEENCECEIAIDTEGAKEGDAKEHPEKDVQKHTGGSARGHGKPVPHGGHGGPKNDSEVSECVHECIESLDTDGVCKREGKGRKNGNMTVVDQEMYDGEHGLNGSRGEHKPTEECRTFVEESCECEIAIDIKETKEGDAKEHSEKDVQKNTGGSARGHGKPVPHGGHGGPRKGGEFSECVHECIRSLDTDGVCKREEREQAEAVDSE
ncbi:hypothetical protein SARC_02227 [Sphaeroforma arctica JP610]|uniref:Uncharacterized protein n=1 Tax=Sphaeroforma arctica JP610 TaxID=667725 RepID=A0A0L0G9R3_9EUKA|nr:hypothetical protein SARC_02227 [Sphaeroforma arctica JP610]KNC85606.1 hypothetical protein SARC_02227 [Sphaeroforma arctica JP610]|eukprot:XP_014159508.1 hypothetical protein SARC_02227 [Sphaeroforma arctica JP610]